MTTILHKRGTGIPPADQLKVGEIAIDTLTGKLYTKQSDGSVVEIGGGSEGGGGDCNIPILDSPPANPELGQQWFSSTDGYLYIWYGAEWVAIGGAGGGGGGGSGGDGGGGSTGTGLAGSARIPDGSVDFWVVSDNGNPADNVFTLGAGDFTVEAWVRTQSSVASIFNSDGGSTQAPAMFISNNGYLRWNNAYAISNLWELPTAKLNAGSWHHIRVCRSSGTHIVYIDGVNRSSECTGSLSDSKNYSTPEKMRLGKHSETPNNAIDYADIRIVRGAALSTGASFTLPTEPVGVADSGETLLCLSFTDNAGTGKDNYLDLSGKNHVITATNNAAGAFASPYNSNPYISMPTEKAQEGGNDADLS